MHNTYSFNFACPLNHIFIYYGKLECSTDFLLTLTYEELPFEASATLIFIVIPVKIFFCNFELQEHSLLLNN
jgi:hypothetical protein